MNSITYKVMFKGPFDRRATVWSSYHRTEDEALKLINDIFLRGDGYVSHTIDSKGKYHVTVTNYGCRWEDIVYIVKYDGRRKAKHE